MLRKFVVGLLVCQLLGGTAALAAVPVNVDGIKALRAQAIEKQMRGDPEAALVSYEEAVKLSKTLFGDQSSYVAQIYFDEALVALSCNRWQKAEDCLSSALKINPNAITARVKLAELLKLRGRTQQAREHAQSVLRKHKDVIEARQILALTYQEEGNAAKATEECFRLDEALHGNTPTEVVANVPPPPLPMPAPAAIKAVPATADSAQTREEKSILPHIQLPRFMAPAKPKPKAAAPPPRSKPKPKPVAPKSRHNGRHADTIVAKQKSQVDRQITERLKSKAVLLTPVGKKGTKQSEETTVRTENVAAPDAAVSEEPVKKPKKSGVNAVDTGSDNTAEEIVEEVRKPKAVVKKVPPKLQPAFIPMQIQPIKKPRPGLVPPPPPVVPTFQPMPMVMPPPQPQPQTRPRPRPVETVKETPKEHSAPVLGGGDDDSDFLLDWAGKKKK